MLFVISTLFLLVVVAVFCASTSRTVVVDVVIWKGIRSRSDTNRTGPESLFFYYPKLLYCPNQMLAAMLLSPNRVSLFKTLRLRSLFGARCMGHAIKTWSAFCSKAMHSYFGEGARIYSYMDECNCPISVCRRLSLIQAVRGKLILIGLVLVLGIKTRSLKEFSRYSTFHLWFAHLEARMPSRARLFKRFCAAGINERLNFNLSRRASEYPLDKPNKILSSSRDPR